MRWLDLGVDALLVSDLQRSIAAISVDTGAIEWTHTAAGGRLDKIWQIGRAHV